MSSSSSKLLARRAAALVALALALAAAEGPVAADPALPARGEVEVNAFPVTGSDAPRIVVRAVMDLPPKKIWQIVSDCARYKDHMPRVAASELVKKAGNVHTCKVTIAMPFPLSNLTATTEAVHAESDQSMSRRWKLVSGDYKVNEGSWEVKALNAEGTSSLVTYTVHAEPTTAIPAFIRESAQKKALPDMIERVRAEAAKLP
jgi:ribosome-associated toxin RatA of RatAB toxin-antitoxin module